MPSKKIFLSRTTELPNLRFGSEQRLNLNGAPWESNYLLFRCPPTGSDRGECICGNCSCFGNWTGPSCSCTKLTDGCMKDGVRVLTLNLYKLSLSSGRDARGGTCVSSFLAIGDAVHVCGQVSNFTSTLSLVFSPPPPPIKPLFPISPGY